ncbi:hypothetical protein GCM10007886_54260 [Methylobacterium gregans]|nr:hypothetical protein GCM10007886_54260 [Methylobacterium gregans]
MQPDTHAPDRIDAPTFDAITRHRLGHHLPKLYETEIYAPIEGRLAELLLQLGHEQMLSDIGPEDKAVKK